MPSDLECLRFGGEYGGPWEISPVIEDLVVVERRELLEVVRVGRVVPLRKGSLGRRERRVLRRLLRRHR